MNFLLAVSLLSLVHVSQSQAGVSLTTPTESFYELRVWISSPCDPQSLPRLCDALAGLDYKDCAVKSETCITSPTAGIYIDILISFSRKETITAIAEAVSYINVFEDVTIDHIDVQDFNECAQQQHMCHANAYCTNQEGFYECTCSFGYVDSSTTNAAGMECVEKCNSQSCSYFEQCTEGTADQPEVSCTCPPGYSGAECSIKLSPLSKEAVIGLSVIVVLAALTGLALCAYSGYRLFCKKQSISDLESNESQSISEYKPKSLPYDYTQFSELGSFSRGSAFNRGYAHTIHEESEPETLDVTNDGLRYGARRLEARLDADDLVNDPTPFLTPMGRTDRHVYSEVESQPDYF